MARSRTGQEERRVGTPTAERSVGRPYGRIGVLRPDIFYRA